MTRNEHDANLALATYANGMKAGKADMQVTAVAEVAEGQLFSLNNGDALLLQNSSSGGSSPVYVFANGRTYSARTGRFSTTTIVPAMAAVRRFQA